MPTDPSPHDDPGRLPITERRRQREAGSLIPTANDATDGTVTGLHTGYSHTYAR